MLLQRGGNADTSIWVNKCVGRSLLAENIKRLLDISPRGATGDQLRWRLRRAGLRVDPAELLGALDVLSRGGEIEHRGGFWRARRLVDQRPPGSDTRERALDPKPTIKTIEAVKARVLPRQGASDEDLEAVGETVDGLDWDTLLAYYAATQRQDPRGRIVEFPDRHGTGWLLFQAPGRWWRDAELRISTATMPGETPEALSRRRVRTAALGWPLAVLHEAEGPSIVPALLLPAEWDLKVGEIRIWPTAEAAVPNPEWMRAMQRRTRWSEPALYDALLPPGDPDDLSAIGERMRHALSTLGGRALRPGESAPQLEFGIEGLRNAAALFLPDDAAFTKGAADDLERIRGWDRETRRGTALAALIEGPPLQKDREIGLAVAAGPLTEGQFEAVDAALSAPVTLVQGPPGTGKSEVILTLVASALATQGTVLFAARNHQALDEVERRLADLVPEPGLIVRARDATGERDASFLDALAEIAEGEALPDDFRARADRRREALLAVASGAAETRQLAERRRRLALALSDLAERAVLIREGLDSSAPSRPGRAISLQPGLLRRLLARLGLDRREVGDPAEPLPEDSPLAAIERRMADVRRALAQIGDKAPDGSDADQPSPDLRDQLREALADIAPGITRPNESSRAALYARHRELTFRPSPSVRDMSEADARAVLRHRPVWAVGTLSTPARIPTIPALFDLVIFDEASQCDIASAMPLLARARRAVIVGDPRQLSFVPGLGIGAEHALMDAAGLPRAGRAALAQSRNSLFDFAQGRPGVRRVFLADQFRSAPGIVQWLGEEFYEGRLVGRRDEAAFRAPSGWRPGLAFEDVPGRARHMPDGTVNPEEAERVVAIIERLARDKSFDGSLGVVTPVNAQVALIQTLLAERLDSTGSARPHPLRVATADRWQGGEADVILFSPVLAPGAPATLRTFLQRERRRLNVAVSRAKSLCLVVGDLAHLRNCGVKHLERLAERASGHAPPPRPPFDSLWERRLDAAMRARGLSPIPQFPVGHRFLDFALDPEGAMLNVEVDGRRWHLGPDGSRKVEDRLRDRELRARGWRVLRFWVHELAEDIEGCIDVIERELRRA